MKNSLFLALFAGLVLASACKKNTACGDAGPETIELKAGKTFCCDDSDWCITVDSIEDSRCPADAQCIWEGAAIIHFRVVSGGDLIQFGAVSDHENHATLPKNEVSILGKKIRFVSVSPFPTLPSPVPASEMTAKIEVEKE